MSAKASPAAYLAAAVACVVVVVIGYVALTIHGDDTGGLLAFVTPTIAALLLAGQVQSVNKDQEQRHEENKELLVETADTVHAVQRQTNGELDARIRALVREATSEALDQLGVKGVQVLPSRRAGDRVKPRAVPTTTEGEDT